jgi:hypothetical protein
LRVRLRYFDVIKASQLFHLSWANVFLGHVGCYDAWPSQKRQIYDYIVVIVTLLVRHRTNFFDWNSRTEELLNSKAKLIYAHEPLFRYYLKIASSQHTKLTRYAKISWSPLSSHNKWLSVCHCNLKLKLNPQQAYAFQHRTIATLGSPNLDVLSNQILR